MDIDRIIQILSESLDDKDWDLIKELLVILRMGLEVLVLMLVHRIWRNTGHWSNL